MHVESIASAIERHRLPADFAETVAHYYVPLAEALGQKIAAGKQSAPVIIGLQGTQGSGKSTSADFLRLILEERFDYRVLVASIDDFYLTLAQRRQLAGDVHPLLVTRGVPGTHDIAMLNAVLQELRAAQGREIRATGATKVPVFDKAADDRAPRDKWQRIDEQPDVVILEGWCVGIPAQESAALVEPVNDLEANEDQDGHWRDYVNQQLSGAYAQLWAEFDYQIVLQAPSFECVFEWRLLQEQKLADRLQAQGEIEAARGVQTRAQLRRFISHYERLTRHALRVMPAKADFLLSLQADHSINELLITPAKSGS